MVDPDLAGQLGVLQDDPDPLPLCRIRYIGNAHDRHVAIYRLSHSDYEESFFPTGLHYGSASRPLMRRVPLVGRMKGPGAGDEHGYYGWI